MIATKTETTPIWNERSSAFTRFGSLNSLTYQSVLKLPNLTVVFVALNEKSTTTKSGT